MNELRNLNKYEKIGLIITVMILTIALVKEVLWGGMSMVERILNL